MDSHSPSQICLSYEPARATRYFRERGRFSALVPGRRPRRPTRLCLLRLRRPPAAPRRRSRWLLLLSVLGPGVIAAAAGNDAGGIATYSQAGASYGLSLLWSIAVVTVGLIVVQEMCARMGAVTGKGLAALIRENFGVKVTLFAMVVLLLANFATTVSEFAGITAVGELYLGPHARYIIVPIAVVLVWLLVSRGSYQKVERVLLAASLISSLISSPRSKSACPGALVGRNPSRRICPHSTGRPRLL